MNTQSAEASASAELDAFLASSEPSAPPRETRREMRQVDGRWKEVEVEVSAPVESMTEYLDTVAHPMDLGAMWHEGRGRGMHPYWANAKADQHSTQITQGYRPVDPADCPELKKVLPVVKHPVMGDVFQYQDAILMEQPNNLFEARVAKEEETKRLVAESRLGNHRSAAVQKAAEFGISVGSTHDNGNEEWERVSTDDRGAVQREILSSPAFAEANALRAAMQREEEFASGGARTFGGFQGNPRYNKFTPTGPKPNWGYSPV